MQNVTVNINNFSELGFMRASALDGFKGYATTCTEVNGQKLNGILVYVPGLNETMFDKIRDNKVD